MCSHFHKLRIGATNSSGPGLNYEELGNNVGTWKLPYASQGFCDDYIDLPKELGVWGKMK